MYLFTLIYRTYKGRNETIELERSYVFFLYILLLLTDNVAVEAS